MIEQIINYEINLELLLEQFKGSNNLKGIIEASMVQANKIEDALFEIRDLMTIDTATGESLDFIGRVFDEDRLGRSDTDYRAAIKLKGASVFSGEPEVIISVVKSQYGGTYAKYSPEYPGKYRIITDGTISQQQLDQISMAGVTGFLSGYLLDEAGNNIVDEAGNKIIHVKGEN